MSVRILIGDMREKLQAIEPDSLDSCVTDPPYHLTSIVKRFGKPGSAPAKSKETGVYKRASAGFMGQKWDGGDIAFDPATWREVYRVLKPGAHLLAFGGTRGYHRLACAIEDSGFEVRDAIMWHYGSGFPKSKNLGNGWGTALKPSTEIICVARKTLSESSIVANVLEHGTGGLNIDGCRIRVNGREPNKRAPTGEQGGAASIFGVGNSRRGATLTQGRWPANVIHDGSEEATEGFPVDDGGTGEVKVSGGAGLGFVNDGQRKENIGIRNFGDEGSAARFFYCAKADKAERGEGNNHPTVKPLDLMQYLCRLVTPPGGTVLDPFAGSGSTGIAADREGFNAVLIELSADYAEIAKRRLANDAGMFSAIETDDPTVAA